VIGLWIAFASDKSKRPPHVFYAPAAVTAIVSCVMYTGAINEYPTVYGVRLTALPLFSRYDDRGIVSAIDNRNKTEDSYSVARG
jgi:hypothetical protein